MPRTGLPLTAILALALPVLAGLAWMAIGGAPQAYLLVNAAALALAIAGALSLPMPRSHRPTLALAMAIVALLGAPLLFGPEVSGARRWIALGPVRLHIGYLLLPLLVVLTSRLPSIHASAALLAGAAICLIQPDPATVLAIAASIAVLALDRRDLVSVSALVAACVGAIWSLTQPDLVAPVRFVEGVQISAFAEHAGAALALTAAGLLPALLLAQPNAGYRGLSAFMVAAGAAAFMGPYPSILIGYGASPILGIGLALAGLREPARP